jgi:hypothetical protein
MTGILDTLALVCQVYLSFRQGNWPPVLTFKKKNLSPLQRRSIALFAVCMCSVVALTLLRWDTSSLPVSTSVKYLLAVSPALPVAAMMAVVGRYVARETDEFIKTMVTQAVLWAVGFTLIADIIMGALAQFMPQMGRLLPLVSIDLFCLVFIVALRTKLWRNM